MAIDVEQAKASVFDLLQVEVERGRLRFFAKVIGESDPVYVDLDAAHAAGHPDLPVPPTFLFSLTLERPRPLGYLEDLGVDLRHVLHGEQSFDYRHLAFAGDCLTLQDRVVDCFSKRGGALDFVVKETGVHKEDELIAVLRSVIVVRHPEAGQ